MSLNFRDCHAKIRQVDSQATVGNAVVVQVSFFCVFTRAGAIYIKILVYWLMNNSKIDYF